MAWRCGVPASVVTNRFSISAPTSTPRPSTLRNLVNMENLPPRSFSLLYVTLVFVVAKMSEASGDGGEQKSGRCGVLTDARTLPSLIGPSGG